MECVIIKPPFQTSFKIITNCKDLIRLLRLKYGKYLIASTSSNYEKSIMAVKKDGIYQVEYANTTVQDNSGTYAIDEIIANNTVYDENIFALHGAAVEWNEKAYLFLASTTSGKSTLTSFLTTNGLGYITDDCILLDRASFYVYQFNTPIHLREGGLKILKSSNAAPDNLATIDDEKFERYVYTPANCIDKPVALDKIFFINRTEHENHLSPMNTTERMTALMKSPITLYTVTPEYLKFLSGLAQKDCFYLNYCDMDFVLDVIKNG